MKAIDINENVVTLISNNRDLIKSMAEHIINKADTEDRLDIFKLFVSDSNEIGYILDINEYSPEELVELVKEYGLTNTYYDVINVLNAELIRIDIFEHRLYVNTTLKVKKYYASEKDKEDKSYSYRLRKDEVYSIAREDIITDYMIFIDYTKIDKSKI